MSDYSLLGLDEPTANKKKNSTTPSSSKYSALGLDAVDTSKPAPAPVAPTKPTEIPANTTAELPTYTSTIEKSGKSPSIWSKVGGFLKGAGEEAVYLGGKALNWVQEQRKKNEVSDFRMRQIMYPRTDDPIRIVEKDGKKVMTNNALDAYDAAKSDEEKAKIVSEDTKKIPIIKALNSDTGKKITKAIADNTSNIPLKAWARLQTVGDEITDAFNDPTFQNFADIYQSTRVLPYANDNEETKKKYQEHVASLEAKANDPNNPHWKKILYGVQNSGVQSAIGTLLSVGTSYLSRNPQAGAAVGTAYFGALSAEEERQKYEGGNIDSTSAIGNIAIDTIGDQMISNVAEGALKNFAKESSKATLKSIAAETAKGFLVEGGTEPTQSLLKYANDYTAARTDERKQAVVNDFSNYIKSGAMVDEFLIGGISGAAINLAATGAGALSKPIYNHNGTEISAKEIDTMKQSITDEVTKAIETGNFDDIVNVVENKLDVPEEAATKIVQDTVQDVVAENSNREAAQGSAERDALEQDVTTLLQQGQSPVDVSEQLQNLIGVSQSYAEDVVATALGKLQNTITQTSQETNTKLDEIANNTEKDNVAYEDIAAKLKAAKVQDDVTKKVADDLVVAINRKGTVEQKQAAIKTISNPANNAVRALYEQETGITLPETREESVKVLEREIMQPASRQYARQVISADLNQQGGYRRNVGEASATNSKEGTRALPEYIPEELRSPALVQEAQQYLDKGIRPPKDNEQLNRLYDILQTETDKVAEEYEKDEIDIDDNTPTTGEAASIPYQVAAAQITNESLITMGEAEEIVRKYFDSEEVPLQFVKNLRTPRGVEAWGKYSKQVISLIENPRADTPHHESVHAFLDLFVPEYERQRFLKTAYSERLNKLGKEVVDAQLKDLAARYNGALSEEKVMSIYSEEALADGFYEYLQGRNQKTALQKFYDMVIAFIKSLRDEADASRLYEEIIAKKRYNKARAQEAMKLAQRIAYAQEKGIDPSLFSIKNRIHPEDKALLEKFIDHARIGTELTDAEFKGASRLAEKWGISMDKPLKTIANQFEKALTNQKKVTGTILYSEKSAKPFLREGQPEVREGNNYEDTVARERFDIPNLEKVSFGGSDRDVYALGDNMVIKIVKTARGISQNDFSSDYYAEDQGLIPKTIETGKNYIVKERVLSPDANTKKMIAELKKEVGFIGEHEYDAQNKAFDIMEKYGYNGSDLANYSPLWGDVIAIRNWGTTREGKPVMLDEGTLNGGLIKNHQTGGNNLSDPTFLEMYNQSRAAKKRYGDLDAKTMYSEGGASYEDELNAIIRYKKETYGGRYTQAEQKADGFKFSAIKRALNGNLTGVEMRNALNYLNSAYVGKKVKFDGMDVTIASTPSFGKVKIEYGKDVEGAKFVEISKLKQAPATEEQALAYAKAKAENEARGQIALYGSRLEKAAEDKQASITRSSTYATKPFQELSEKVPAFKGAYQSNTETQAINLGKEKVEVKDAKVQKASGKTDGLFTEAYTVVIKRGNKERVIFSSESDQEAIDWLKKNAGKNVSIEKSETANLFVDKDEAHVIVTSPDIIPFETSAVAGITEAKKVTFYDTEGQKIETKEITQDNTDYKPVAAVTRETEEAKPKLVPYTEATKDRSLKATFPSYFALINSRPVLVQSDNMPVSRETYVDESKVTRSEKEQPTQQPIEPNLNEDNKVKRSGAYKKARARLAEQYQEDVTYTAMKIDDQMAKAFELLDNNPEYAKAVALGLEQPPLDIADTAISLAVAERAKETGDYALQAEAEKARSLRQTRRGQELVLERGRVDENAPEFFIRQLIERRKELARMKFKPILAKARSFMEMLDERVTEAKKKGAKKLKSELEIKGEELDSFLAEMKC